MNRKCSALRAIAVAWAGVLLAAVTASPEVILQYFNTSWDELAYKMPELAEVGYGAIWLPPPTKGSGGLSVGYDLVDPFDLGGKDQRGTVRTRYGTDADLLRLIETAHRFGIRVYVDNIMNHRAFDVPGYNENTAIDVYPGMVPEDFHLRVTEDGFYRKWDNVANWGDTWQIQYRNFSDLIDIAQESPVNGNFGTTEGSSIPKITFVRHPNNPEYYCYMPSATGAVYIGFGTTNITATMLTNSANAWLYKEDVGGYLIRAERWLVDHTKIDGLRLDAVKHVPDYFFGMQSGNKDPSSAGYCGQAQEQFNFSRGFTDWDNHRDTVFDTEATYGRNDLMMFGEHLGEPPSFSGYISAGMRLVDSQLHGYLNGNLGESWGTLDGLQYAGGHGFSSGTGVPYTKSHDDDYATRPELHFALNLTREGLPNIYTDGNYQSETLAQSGGAFPRHANTAFLGQFSDNRIPNLVYIHNQFSRSTQVPRWGDGDVCAYERVDKRENSPMSDSDGAVLFFVMNDNYSSGQYREISTSFGVGAKLWQYSSAGGNFYYTVPADQKIKVIIPPGGYFAFSWRSPEESDLWTCFGGKPVTIYQGNDLAGWISYRRHDGPNGDPAFNPYGVADSDPTDYAYNYYVPRVTSPTNLRFVCHADGSAYNVLMKLDGGMNLNDINHSSGDPRDYPPGNTGSMDMFLGYEQAHFVHRQYREKFAAKDTSTRNVIGSAGAETYYATIGSAGFNVSTGSVGRDSDVETASWSYHDPEANNDRGQLQFSPAPASAAGSNLTVWVKIGYETNINKVFFYYTTDGSTWPEGGGGQTWENTKAVEMYFDHDDAVESNVDWWKGTIPAQSGGTVLRYKIGCFNVQNGVGVGWDCPFPGTDYNIGRKKSMMGIWDITNFNPSTVVYRPHDDFGNTSTGLVEGFHVLSGRTFLQRDGSGVGNGKYASIYNTFVQSFYFDASTPTGEVKYPTENESLGSKEYGAVVRTDPTVNGVYYNISDSDPNNDDGRTGLNNGNGTNASGQTAWINAYEVTPSLSVSSVYPREWRFTYRNIPAGGTNGTLNVKLCELSSSTNLNLSDSAGHYTTLVRHFYSWAPAYDLYVAWPQYDGDYVWENYNLKVDFSKVLADGIDETTLRNRFILKINDVAQDRNDFNFTYNIDANHHELSFTLPNLFNGDSNFLHNIQVVHTNAGGGGITLQAGRYVKAQPSVSGPHIDIINPPEFDSDGKAYEIVLPDVASPSPTQRQFNIRVETDLTAKNVWLLFWSGSGYTVPFGTTTNAMAGKVNVVNGTNLVTGTEIALTGTVSVTTGSATVTGSGTAFNNALITGTVLRITTNLLTVTQIVSQTSLNVDVGYPGPSGSGLTASIQPAFNMELSAGDRLRIGTNLVSVSQVLSTSNLLLEANYPGASASGLTAWRLSGNPSVSGTRMYWNFMWTNMTEGYFSFNANMDTNNDLGSVEAYATRNTRVIFREIVPANTNDFDDDDDGLYDEHETNATNLPPGNSELWNNGDVHIYNIYGRSDPLKPDTDGDGLPDGLELGWRAPVDISQTDTNTDTNGDGWKNFSSDRDPPFFNTLDNSSVPGYVFYDSRTKLIAGSMTDPSLPDTDYDGLPDGIEDANHNGWIDGDGSALEPTQDKGTRASWPDGVWDAAWTETSPNKFDTDGDGASDGYGEDTNFNGRIDGDTDLDRVYDAGEAWTESNPLNPDTDSDGLPDGWETAYWLDPLDNGTNTLRTAALADGNVTNGANGNPDGDFIIEGIATNPYINIKEYRNGTNPRVADTLEPPPPGSITIGRGAALGSLTGTSTNYQEFTDWTADDCLVLDEYEGDGINNQGGDLYMGWDGYDSSRDIVAFYARDGGAANGKFYFRIDLQDLQAHAEEGFADYYVVIDTGNPAQGEVNLPDEVDCSTSCRWEVVVAVYQTGLGRVYVDTDNINNTTAVGQDLYAKGVVARDQSTPNGFIEAYYNANMDSVEFSISRTALTDAGWNGLDAHDLNYQVFSTKDGTCNSCNGGQPGPGDIGGRNDIRDTIYDDEVAEDYWTAQSGIRNVLSYWFNGGNHAGRGKLAVVLHGNQAIQPGSYIQSLIDNDAGAGYHRALDVHELYRQPVNLHITPTLASAIQWAKVDPATNKPWLDGPSFNDRIARLMQTNVVYLLGSTFSDHMLPYFTTAFNADNASLANDFMHEIYGFTPNTNTVFWTPERVLDSDVLSKIQSLGYRYTLIDQMTHMFFWLGRNTALGDSGYKINKINGLNCFVMDDGPSGYRFSNQDGGLNTSLRNLMNRKARSGTQDQVVTLFSNWEDFGTKSQADAYDVNLIWIANHPWVDMVALEQVAAGQVDTTGDGNGDTWYVEDRGTATRAKTAYDWLQHATELSYDNWYIGSGYEQSLQSNYFSIRTGVNLPVKYGMMYFDGLITDAWLKVTEVMDTNLAKLARAALHASVFETAFHNETNQNGTARYSTGEYIYPDTTWFGLAQFAKNAQAQTRMAAIVKRAYTWGTYAAGLTSTQTATEDVDLDGESEYLLYNDRVFAVFERIGGRLIGVWVRNILGSDIYQALGNQISYAGSETEEEGTYNAETNGTVGAYRTSGLKDWWAVPAGGGGTLQYVNGLYDFVNWTNGWKITSTNGTIRKIVTLGATNWSFNVAYQLYGALTNGTLYIRNGFSPNLYDLLLHGQRTLGNPQYSGGIMNLANTSYVMTVKDSVGYSDAGHNAGFNTGAVDDDLSKNVSYNTINMRNQAETQQVEIYGSNTISFALGFQATLSDWDGDGMPNAWEDAEFGNQTNAGSADNDKDGMQNWEEYIANTDPTNAADYLKLVFSSSTSTGVVIRFQTKTARKYFVDYNNQTLSNPSWVLATTNGLNGTGNVYEWLDNGTLTAPNPLTLTSRFYRISVDLPQ